MNSVLHTIRKSINSSAYRTRKSMAKIYADADYGEHPISAAINLHRPLKKSSTVGSFHYKPAPPGPASFRHIDGSEDGRSDSMRTRRWPIIPTIASLWRAGSGSDAHQPRHADAIHGASQHGHQTGASKHFLAGESEHGSPGKLKHDLSKSVLSHDEHVCCRTHHTPPPPTRQRTHTMSMRIVDTWGRRLKC
jgi:hypothetical protein